MTFAQTLDRFLILARELWSSQGVWILALSAFAGLLYLLPDAAAVPLGFANVLALAALAVFWLRVAAAEGSLDAAAFEGKDPEWLVYLGVVLGVFTIFAALALVSMLPIIITPLFGVVSMFIWFVLVLLLVLYEPVVYVEAEGFGDAMAKTWALLRRFERREVLLEARFWYPFLLGLAAALPQFFLPEKGFAAAVGNFLVALVQIPWFVAQLIVLYENIWHSHKVAIK